MVRGDGQASARSRVLARACALMRPAVYRMLPAMRGVCVWMAVSGALGGKEESAGGLTCDADATIRADVNGRQGALSDPAADGLRVDPVEGGDLIGGQEVARRRGVLVRHERGIDDRPPAVVASRLRRHAHS